jgi:cysteine synthase
MSDEDTDRASQERRQKLRKAGVAVGIGSAAVVAALLYASNVKKKPKKTPVSAKGPDATD